MKLLKNEILTNILPAGGIVTYYGKAITQKDS
jgi:hypothetical protein